METILKKPHIRIITITDNQLNTNTDQLQLIHGRNFDRIIDDRKEKVCEDPRIFKHGQKLGVVHQWTFQMMTIDYFLVNQ